MNPYASTPLKSKIIGLTAICAFVMAGWTVFKFFDNRDWPSVTGRVTEVNVVTTYNRSGRGGSVPTHSVHVKYLYLVDHVSYVKDEVVNTSIDYGATKSYMEKQYWKGQHIRVMYRPGFPQDSSLNRSTF